MTMVSLKDKARNSIMDRDYLLDMHDAHEYRYFFYSENAEYEVFVNQEEIDKYFTEMAELAQGLTPEEFMKAARAQ